MYRHALEVLRGVDLTADLPKASGQLQGGTP
jgi:hypothetical protein